MRKLVLWIAIVVVIVFAFTQWIRRTAMFFPDRFPGGDWTNANAQDVSFETSDGVKLHGWLFRAADAGAPLLIWFHGNGGNLTHRAEMAEGLARRGVSVFLFDWRGYGKSEGRPTESALFRDAEAAWKTARQFGAKDIVLYGESLGGPYAAYVAKKRGARAVILENSFPSLTALGNALYHPLPLGYAAPFALRTTDWLNEANVPVLVMHGRRDSVIPFRLGQQIHDGLRVRQKELFVSEHADHAMIPEVEGERYYEAVIGFVQRVAAAAPPVPSPH